LFAHVHFEDVARLTELHQEVLEHGGRVEADVRIIQPTGELRHVRLACVGQLGTDGSVLALHGTMLDLTEQHRLQERLMHAQKMEAIGRLAGGIAHDFNNLLMVVRGNLELLGGGERAELRAIMSAVESAQTLTAGLLAFGRKAHLERRVLDLNALVTQTVGLLQRLIGEHITLSAVLDEELPPVEVDASLVQQALINLVINARDVLVDGGTITVRTRALLESDASFAQLEVEDDGPGIDEAHRARIFEPFFTTKAVGKGSGLGLAMVHGTVAQHGGSVRVTSRPGSGSCFTLRFPAAVARPGSVPPKPERVTLDRVLRRTVLVVEDDPGVARVLLELLLQAGYTALLAQLPSEALALATQSNRIDVVLCDLMMPEMHGTELAAQLQRHNPSLRILFMSGYSGGSAKLPRGAKLLGKPFSLAELDNAIQAVLAEPTLAVNSA
jgi:signal transduction histidine kinase